MKKIILSAVLSTLSVPAFSATLRNQPIICKDTQGLGYVVKAIADVDTRGEETYSVTGVNSFIINGEEASCLEIYEHDSESSYVCEDESMGMIYEFGYIEFDSIGFLRVTHDERDATPISFDLECSR